MVSHWRLSTSRTRPTIPTSHPLCSDQTRSSARQPSTGSRPQKTRATTDQQLLNDLAIPSPVRGRSGRGFFRAIEGDPLPTFCTGQGLWVRGSAGRRVSSIGDRLADPGGGRDLSTVDAPDALPLDGTGPPALVRAGSRWPRRFKREDLDRPLRSGVGPRERDQADN